MHSAFGVEDERISKRSAPMSDVELRRRKKLSAGTSTVGGALGLASLATKGVATAAKRPGLARGIPRILGRVGHNAKGKSYAKDLDEAATTLAIGGAGIGGLAAFNNASIVNEESKRKQLPKQRVAKSAFGVEISKVGEWKTIDQRELQASKARRSRRRGMAAAGTGATIAAGAIGAGGAENAARQAGGLAGTTRNIVQMRRAGFFGSNAAAAKQIGHAVKARPYGAALLGGAALTAAGGAGAGQGHAREKYHQHKINQRRRDNRKRLVAKAYDPEAKRHRREKARTGALVAGAAGATGAAVRPRKMVRVSVPDVEAQKLLREKGQAQLRQSAAQASYTRNYKGMARATAAEDALKVAHQGVRNVAASSGKAGQRIERVNRTNKQIRVARTKSGAVAALLGTGAVASERHRKRGGRSYDSWYS